MNFESLSEQNKSYPYLHPLFAFVAPLLISPLLNVLIFSTLDDALEDEVLVRISFLVLILRYICNKHSKDDQIPKNQTEKVIV